MKEKLIFVAEIAAVFAGLYLLQTKVFKLPVIGEYLPGGQ